MRPSLQPRKQSLQPNTEAAETIQNLHKKDIKFISRNLEKIRFLGEKTFKEIRYPQIAEEPNETKIKEINYHDVDYGFDLSLFGFLMGGWIGYLFRPSINVLGFEAQIPFEKIIDGLMCNDPYGFSSCKLEQSLAYASVEYIITGAILGAVIGWVVGKLIKKNIKV